MEYDIHDGIFRVSNCRKLLIMLLDRISGMFEPGTAVS